MRTLTARTRRHAMIWLAPQFNVGRWTLNVERCLLGLLVISSPARGQDPTSVGGTEGRTSNVQRPTFNVQLGDGSDSLSPRDLARWDLTFAQIPSPTPAPNLPLQFNPDPGVPNEPASIEPPSLFPPVIPPLPNYGDEPLPPSLELPRKGVHEVAPVRSKLNYEEYPSPEPAEDLLPGSKAVPNRWFIGFGRWKRYADPSTETPYQSGSVDALASLLAKQAQRRRSDHRSGHLSQPDGQRFLSIRSAPVCRHQAG